VTAPVSIESAIYLGRLRHRRFAPTRHAFTYPLFMVLLDVDRIDELMTVSRFTSRNAFNWASFDDRDHLGDPALPLRQRIERDAAVHGVALPANGRMFMLTHLRYLGYCFNPISFVYCVDESGRVSRVLAEVSNTFGGAHRYWLAAGAARPPAAAFHASADKALYVSPFLGPALRYRFDLTAPADSLVSHIAVEDAGRTVFDATLTLRRRPWTAREMRRALLRHPAMTASVITAIHWEAFRLWLKGVPVVPRPA
jgi:DUF1365 family protein